MKKIPFDKAYVLKTTAKYLRRSIDISIRKTFDRRAEFQSDSEKITEIYDTLDVLHQMRLLVEHVQVDNAEHFKEPPERESGQETLPFT